MDRAEILAAEAGEELDNLVSEALSLPKPGSNLFIPPTNMYFYSRDIKAAWKVVDELLNRGLQVDLKSIPSDGKKTTSYCNIFPSKIGGAMEQTGLISASSMPEAICRAALLAKLRMK